MKSFIPIIFIAVIYVNIGMAMMTGGWSPVKDMNSTDLQKCVEFATDEISLGMNSLYHMRQIEILKAEKQVVSGMNYKFTFRMGFTECKKNMKYSKEDIKQCDILECEPVYNCNATVWYQPWNNEKKEMTEHSCKSEPRKC